MEQSVEVRYTFLMLLAIADPTGRVVGTDIAIARRLNVPVDDFVKSVKTLGEPDADSNSKEEEGRRVMPSDGERGYQLVNFLKYRNLKDEDEKREYMREYMRKRRAVKSDVKDCKTELNVLAKVTQAEATAEATADKEEQPSASVASKKAEIQTQEAEFLATWNGLDGLPKCLLFSPERKRKLATRLKDGFFSENWRAAMAKVHASVFCRGEGSSGWKADFDWLLRPGTCVKIMEGKYDGKLSGGVAAGGLSVWKRVEHLEEEEKSLAGRLHQFFDREADPAGVARLTAVRLELSKLKT